MWVLILLLHSNHFMSAATGSSLSGHPIAEGGRGRGGAAGSFTDIGLGETVGEGGEGGDILEQWRLARRLAEGRLVPGCGWVEGWRGVHPLLLHLCLQV